MIRKIFNWIFATQLEELKTRMDNVKKYEDHLKTVLGNMDISVDVHMDQYSPNWAVISIQGQKSDYIKFIDLGRKDVQYISSFLRQFERTHHLKVDAAPQATKFLKIRKTF